MTKRFHVFLMFRVIFIKTCGLLAMELKKTEDLSEFPLAGISCAVLVLRLRSSVVDTVLHNKPDKILCYEDHNLSYL